MEDFVADFDQYPLYAAYGPKWSWLDIAAGPLSRFSMLRLLNFNFVENSS